MFVLLFSFYFPNDLEDKKTKHYLFVLLLASVSWWPQSPWIIINNISKNDFFCQNINTKFNLKRQQESYLRNYSVISFLSELGTWEVVLAYLQVYQSAVLGLPWFFQDLKNSLSRTSHNIHFCLANSKSSKREFCFN